jgi:hypothetical protein
VVDVVGEANPSWRQNASPLSCMLASALSEVAQPMNAEGPLISVSSLVTVVWVVLVARARWISVSAGVSVAVTEIVASATSLFGIACTRQVVEEVASPGSAIEPSANRFAEQSASAAPVWSCQARARASAFETTVAVRSETRVPKAVTTAWLAIVALERKT